MKKTVRIYEVNTSLTDTFKIVAKNKDVARPEILRPIIREIVESYSDDLKKKNDSIQTNELKVGGIHEKIAEDLENIAANLGVSVSQLLRIKLYEKAQQLPSELLKIPSTNQAHS